MSAAPQTICPITGKANTFLLGDDGTLDTVVYCSECGREARYSYSNDVAMFQDDCGDNDNLGSEQDYDAWVTTILLDAAELHMDDETEITA